MRAQRELGDRKPKAAPGGTLVTPAVEAPGDERQFVRWTAGTFVLDGKDDLARPALETPSHEARKRRVLDRVLEEIAQSEGQKLGVCGQGDPVQHRIHFDPQALADGVRVDDLVDDGAGVETCIPLR